MRKRVKKAGSNYCEICNGEIPVNPHRSGRDPTVCGKECSLKRKSLQNAARKNNGFGAPPRDEPERDDAMLDHRKMRILLSELNALVHAQPRCGSRWMWR